jgi:branched-chain amino acid transport system permease protein
MTELLPTAEATLQLPYAISFDFLTDLEFWTRVGVLAGIYTLFALGLQINVGFTGIVNFGQAGFMAIGAYTMGILVSKEDWSFWLALPTAVLAAMAFGVVVGLSSLRLRADYFAIVTIAAAEIVRLTARNARDLTNGNQGLPDPASEQDYDIEWLQISDNIYDWLTDSVGWTDAPSQFPLLLVIWGVAIVCMIALVIAQRSPWGRVLRAIREDEDAARALGKNTLLYKLQSIAIAAALGALAGFFLAFDLRSLFPTEFEPQFTFIGYAVLILGGLANYWGVAIGAIIMQALLESTRFLDLGITDEREAALRFILVGVVLILVMALRPQGMFGKRQEMVLGD